MLLGGPVNVESMFAVVHREPIPGDKSIPLTTDMSLAFDAATVDQIIEQDGNAARFFVGLVVWQPGELERSCRSDFWFVMRNDAEIVFRKSTDGLWEELVRKSRDMLLAPYRTACGPRGVPGDRPLPPLLLLRRLPSP